MKVKELLRELVKLDPDMEIGTVELHDSDEVIKLTDIVIYPVGITDNISEAPEWISEFYYRSDKEFAKTVTKICVIECIDV